MQPQATSRRRISSGWLAAAVVVATLVAYLPALRGGFIWNDSDYVTRPDLRSWHGLGRLWFEPGVTDQYYPVLYSAFWIEHRLWGDAAVGYHLVNVLLHAAAACLFAVVLGLLRDGAAPGLAGRERRGPAGFEWFAGFVFALHPVCVESVAWITEQKNTLSTVFYLLAAWAYLRYWGRRRLQSGNAGPMPQSGPSAAAFYGLASGFFALALLSKTVTSTLPAALWVVCWWQSGRLRLKEDVAPLLPWLVVGAALGLFTAWIERHYVGAEGAAFALTLGQRALLAGHVVWFYLGKLLWPARLIFIYPRWRIGPGEAGPALYAVGVLALLAAAWLGVRLGGSSAAARAPLAALLFFIGTLFPALGFFNVYAFIFSFVADHFQYLAALGIIAGVAGGWGWLAGRTPLLGHALALVVVGTLGALTWRQCRMYRDGDTLYRATLERNPAAWMAQNNLANDLFAEGRPAEAIEHYRAVLRLQPDFADAHYNLANALARAGRLDEAIVEYAAAAKLRPGDVHVRNDFGAALMAAGRPTEAIAQYEAALRLSPGAAEIYYNLGSAFGRTGRLAQAIRCLQAALRLKPDYAAAESNLGAALAESGRWTEAIAHDRRAIRLDPASARAHHNLAVALIQVGQWTEAREEFDAAARLEREAGR